MQASLFDQQPKPAFFNTLHLEGKELKEATTQTGKQDSRVLDIFRKAGKLTPVDAWEAYCRDFPVCPLTSIRRSITVLTGLGLLQKLNEKKPGKYGKDNYCWKIV